MTKEPVHMHELSAFLDAGSDVISNILLLQEENCKWTRHQQFNSPSEFNLSGNLLF